MSNKPTVPLLKDTWTTDEAAARYGKVTSRISQVCRELDIGEMIRGRILTAADIKKLDRYFTEKGRNRGNK